MEISDMIFRKATENSLVYILLSCLLDFFLLIYKNIIIPDDNIILRIVRYGYSIRFTVKTFWYSLYKKEVYEGRLSYSLLFLTGKSNNSYQIYTWWLLGN